MSKKKTADPWRGGAQPQPPIRAGDAETMVMLPGQLCYANGYQVLLQTDDPPAGGGVWEPKRYTAAKKAENKAHWTLLIITSIKRLPLGRAGKMKAPLGETWDEGARTIVECINDQLQAMNHRQLILHPKLPDDAPKGLAQALRIVGGPVLGSFAPDIQGFHCYYFTTKQEEDPQGGPFAN
jgi:hypothetical protein